MRLDELLMQQGVAAPTGQIRRALEAALEAGRHPVAALVDEGIVVEDVLAEVLARAFGTVVIELDSDVRADPEGLRLVPRSVARSVLALPLAGPRAEKRRAVFVNPFDDEAADVLETALDGPVQRLVGNLSSVRAAIERAYEGRTTDIRGEAGLTHEITRRVRAPESDLPPQDTSPLVRLEQEATMEQRHEALLLALIERGLLTRADYAAALERLLSGRRDER